MKAVVTVTLKPDVLDPQGQAIGKACHSLGHESVRDVRQGKYFEIDLGLDDPKQAQALLEELGDKLLANPVIEDFQVRLEH